ncbi:MAG: hypothetical protein U0270_38575 [Labilithrix sp.]
MLGRVLSLVSAFGLVAAVACGGSDDATPTTDGGAASATVHCRAIPDADSFCSCEVSAEAPTDGIDTCEATSTNVACCNLPGSTGAGNGKGLCGCKAISCSEFTDGSCTCRTGDASTEKPVEVCEAPDEGHCCKSEGSYCTCSASPCFAGDEEVTSCNPAEMAKTACAKDETKVTDCKASLK